MKNCFLLILLFVCTLAPAQNQIPEKVYRTTEVDVKPNLAPGMYTLTKFVSDNFQFPEIRNKKIRIFTSFVVETDGSMSEIKAFYISVGDLIPSDAAKNLTEDEKLAEQKVFDGMRTEAARVLGLFTSKWSPAEIAGKPVRCLFNYPISFNIE